MPGQGLAPVLRRLKAAVRPSGLLNWRYLWPPAMRDTRVAAHRQIWLAARGRMPVPVWLLLELLGWLRWTAWSSRRGVSRAVAFHGAEVAARDGIPVARQRRIALRLALSWGIPAYEAYRFGLVGAPETALDFVYDCESASFHRLQSPGGANSARLLMDKVATADRLARLGIRQADTRAVVPRLSDAPLAPLLPPSGAVFCKTRSGKEGRGAFAAWRDGTYIRGTGHDGTPLDDDQAVGAAWRALLMLDDALIQPVLIDHPEIAPISASGELTTIRCITRIEAGSPRPWNAVLEVAIGSAPPGRQMRYAILPLDVESGALLDVPEGIASMAAASIREARARAPDLDRIPHWPAVIAGSVLAHGAVPDLWAVGWDWAITPDGAVLLEGNSGFGLGMPQLFGDGPLLRERNLARP